MCRRQNNPPTFSKPGSQYDRSCWMSSGDASGTVQCNLRLFDRFRLLSIKKWVWIPKNVLRRHMLLVRPLYEAVIAAGEGHVCFWTTFAQVI